MWGVHSHPLTDHRHCGASPQAMSVDPNARVQSSCLRTLGVTPCVLTFDSLARTQIVSTGSDGLLVLWGVRTGAAVATLDGHDDKAWALASDADGDVLATGGADAKLTLWEDGTAEAAEEEAKELALKAGTQQALSNAAASGEHLKAAHLALKLGHPFALRKAIEAMIADPEGHGDAALDSFCSGMKGKTLPGISVISSGTQMRNFVKQRSAAWHPLPPSFALGAVWCGWREGYV